MNWRETNRQPSSLPGQRWLFDHGEPAPTAARRNQASAEDTGNVIDESGQRLLAYYGHHQLDLFTGESECPDVC